MCKVLNVPRSSVYYKHKIKDFDCDIDLLIIKIFKDSKKNYGSRKIKIKLLEYGYIVSLRRIRRIMSKYGLVSNYTIKQFKIHNSNVNDDNIPNIVDRKFNNRDLLEVVISDLTYVRVFNKWCYVCLIIDLFNREIIGYSASRHKDSSIVEKAFKSIKYDLNKISVFHSDRGNEFKNSVIENILDYSIYGILNSLNANIQHAKQVYFLSSVLFDELKPLHRLEDKYLNIFKIVV